MNSAGVSWRLTHFINHPNISTSQWTEISISLRADSSSGRYSLKYFISETRSSRPQWKSDFTFCPSSSTWMVTIGVSVDRKRERQVLFDTGFCTTSGTTSGFTVLTFGSLCWSIFGGDLSTLSNNFIFCLSVIIILRIRLLKYYIDSIYLYI